MHKKKIYKHMTYILIVRAMMSELCASEPVEVESDDLGAKLFSLKPKLIPVLEDFSVIEVPSQKRFSFQERKSYSGKVSRSQR